MFRIGAVALLETPPTAPERLKTGRDREPACYAIIIPGRSSAASRPGSCCFSTPAISLTSAPTAACRIKLLANRASAGIGGRAGLGTQTGTDQVVVVPKTRRLAEYDWRVTRAASGAPSR